MSTQAMMDLLIRNAQVYDGLGGEPLAIDVGIKDGLVAWLGPSWAAPQSEQSINATGLCLMPGIIDSHTHYDAQITWDSTLKPSPALGVTTAVIGNCGFCIAPCRPEHREMTMRHLTQVEGMSLEVLRHGIDWRFESFSEYLNLLNSKGCSINVAAYIGHSSVRTYVMGEAATQRAATEDELAAMEIIVREAMAAGAIGLASSTSPAHNGQGGKPMPSRLATDEEHLRLIKAMGEKGHGIYMVTKGGQMPIALLEQMSAQSGRPVVIAALLHNNTNPTGVFKDLDAISTANERGRRLIGQVSCCPLSMDFTMASPYPVEGLQTWREALGKTGQELITVLSSSQFREQVKAELDAPTTFRLFNGEWDKVQITEAASRRYAQFEQQPLDQVASILGKHPLDAMLDIAIEESLKTVFTAMLLNSNEEAVGKMLNHSHSIISLSDAGAHLTFFNDAGFGLHLMGHWARDRKIMSLAKAIEQLTSFPAGVLGIQNRGIIKVGFAADLLLFDAATVGRGPKYRVNDLPEGAARLNTDGLGVKGVWVNGQLVANQNGMLPLRVNEQPSKNELPGRLLTQFNSCSDPQ
jgi:N-acyl-D-amino-acid deacylase